MSQKWKQRGSSQRDGEKTGDGKPRKVGVSGRRGVSAMLAASGHIGKDRDLVIKFAPWRSLVPLTIAFFKGQ